MPSRNTSVAFLNPEELAMKPSLSTQCWQGMHIGRLLCIGWRTTSSHLGLALGILAGSYSLQAIAQESVDARTTSVSVPEMRVVDGDKQRYVHAPRATVRCGPASSYYATGLLEQGTAVEVYVETADGWSGIRPPEGSHNWVRAESVYLMPGGRVAEVAGDHVPAWVGAASESVEKLLFQTELAKSQTVAILDEAYRLEENADKQEPTKKLWFKIAPPQGEFRWVKTAMLGRDAIATIQQTKDSKSLASSNTQRPDSNLNDIGAVSKNTSPKNTAAKNNKSQSGPGRIVEKSKMDQGVSQASYQAEPNNTATSTRSKNRSQGLPSAANQPSEETTQGNLAWSDEAQQMDRVQREIQREQAESERKIREAAPEGASTSGSNPSKGKKSSIIKRGPSTTSASNQGSSSQPQASRASIANAPKGAAILRPRPTKPQSYEDRDWQLFQQRDVGPQETDSMNHILGIFGMSLVDPNQIPGHPKQSVAHATGPRDGAIYSQSSPIRSVPTSALASRANRSNPKNALNADRNLAGIDHLPKPSGRYAPSRFTRDYSSELGRNYNDSRYAESSATPWWKTQGPLFGSGIPSDEFANRDRDLAGSDLYGYDSRRDETLRDETLRDEASGEGSESRRIGSTMLASGTSMRTSENDSMLRATEEVERFRTPAIQDALTELSIIVSRPVEQWNLAPLRDSAMQWIERGETPLIRGEARLLLDRIERFELLRQRTGSYVTPSPLGPQLSMGPNPSESIDRSQAGRSPSMQSELSGWLVAVHTSLPGQPEFALTDDVGNVKAYVQPTTGLNLRRYTQQMVTVYGPQGYLPNLGAKQIVADRLVRLR